MTRDQWKASSSGCGFVWSVILFPAQLCYAVCDGGGAAVEVGVFVMLMGVHVDVVPSSA